MKCVRGQKVSGDEKKNNVCRFNLRLYRATSIFTRGYLMLIPHKCGRLAA